MIIFNHRFPIDNAALLEKWLFAVKRDKFSPTKCSFICSDHFLENDFSYPCTLPLSATLKKRKLKQNAVPSIFDFPAHLKKQPVKERNPNKRVSQAPHLHRFQNILHQRNLSLIIHMPLMHLPQNLKLNLPKG